MNPKTSEHLRFANSRSCPIKGALLKRKSTNTILALLFVLSASAQVPVANFTASPTSGCAPLVVSFTDQSTNNPKFWNWDFGNGQLSNAQNPIAVYSIPGTYTVTLVVRNLDGTNATTKTSYITVFPSPVANFNADITTGCNPVTVNFTDLSTSAAGAINKWEWDFGDGGTSNLQNPQHTYTVSGYFSVSLKVTSVNGCTGIHNVSRYIRVVSGITPDFEAPVPNTCKPPFNVTINNQTSGPGTLNYTWDLGNGTTSNAINPTASYPADGNYTIKLTATSNLGCIDSVSKTVTLSSLNTSFTSVDSACPGQPIDFTNTSSAGAPSHTWDFGDFTQSGALSPIKSYGGVGTYIVKLVNHFATCTDSTTKTVVITSTVSPIITSNTTASCKPPLTVNFQNNTSGAISWSWNFGDGGTSNLQNPSHTYTSNGTFDVSLTVRTAGGCEGTITLPKYIKIAPGDVAVTNVPYGGCSPVTYSPSLSITLPDSIASFNWNFGDGFTSNSPTPTHTYNAVGQYTLGLTVTTTGGCTITKSYPAGVKVGTPPPVVDFTSSATTPCTNASTQFTNLSSPIANEFYWDFGDGTTSTLSDPTHTFADTGTFTIKFTASYNGCATTTVKTNYITVLPPVAKFTKSVNCASPYTVTFTDASILAAGPTTYLWDFGDGTTATGPGPVAHTFASAGKFGVSLTVTNGVCVNTLIDSISISPPAAVIVASKNVICKYEHIVIVANVDTSLIKTFVWTIGGGPPTSRPQSFDTSFANAGNYPVSVTVTDIYGCSSTTTLPGGITVNGPKAGFSLASKGGCLNSTIGFNDLSTPAGGISKWTFNFGDGSQQDFTAAPYSHQYTKAGIYTVFLTVTDNAGCTDTASIPSSVKITVPKAGFKADDTVFCPGAPMPFTDTSFGSNLTYLWDFGDGNTSTLQNPTNTYAAGNTNYTVKLHITDDVGCSDSVTMVNYAQIRKPTSAFTFLDTMSICSILETKFFFGGTDYDTFEWDFGDGSTTIAMNPSHFYNAYGNYTATLYLYGHGGCVDSSKKVVSLIDPYTATTLTYSPINACNQLLVDFNVATPPNTVFSTFFADGTVDSSQQLSYQHFYSLPGYYVPFVILKDKYDCQAVIQPGSVIQVLGAIPLYNIDKKKFCDTGNVFITNYTITNDPIVSQVWDFGDGTTSSVLNPFHHYTQPGMYTVNLTVNTQAGCTSSFLDTVRVLRTPVPVILASDTLCLNVPVAFNGATAVPDTAISYHWDFGNGTTSTDSNNVVTYTKTGVYTVKLDATNSLGCAGSTQEPMVVAPNPIVTAQDATIPVGGSIPMPVTYSSGVTNFTWSPSTGLSCTDCPNPIASPTLTTKYTINIIDSNSCAAVGSLTINVICTDKNYFVPNTFSPNGDGMNDIFYPRGNGLTRVQDMRIYNRWGQLIFERKNFDANDPSSGWDGKIGGQIAAPDVYVYVVDFVCSNGQIVPFKGNVMLVR
ncbi:MAG: hypothetical protein C5B52_12765 [Bacteroidetes bacterium]|nr:MAG: hypothetical protein C5B52_12765 [Bacteroidota bacterium]